ncbi:hypothetical protein [Solibacillus merdavium]|uniref:Uncharacterized protein n=1 Tax=Solibacillus merdavium TaxID=2762218 RepID=A0ABR8XLU9_9BACL|nr:hypothetical protein [Solibacillus merdavium]MBD8032922.1 hypothetical protein [Solibacillus merdavium]
MSINVKSYFALALVLLGLLIIFISNNYFVDVHVENIDKAIEILFSSNANSLLIFWILSMTGITIQMSASLVMLKITWESIKYTYYEYSVGIHIILSVIILGISIATILYALKAVIGVFLIAVIVFGLLFLDDKRK